MKRSLSDIVGELEARIAAMPGQMRNPEMGWTTTVQVTTLERLCAEIRRCHDLLDKHGIKWDTEPA